MASLASSISLDGNGRRPMASTSASRISFHALLSSYVIFIPPLLFPHFPSSIVRLRLDHTLQSHGTMDNRSIPIVTEKNSLQDQYIPRYSDHLYIEGMSHKNQTLAFS